MRCKVIRKPKKGEKNSSNLSRWTLPGDKDGKYKRCFSISTYYKMIKNVKKENFINEIDSVEDAKVYYLKDINPEQLFDGYDWNLKSKEKIKDCIKYYFILRNELVIFKRVIFYSVDDEISIVHYFGAKNLPKPTKFDSKNLIEQIKNED